MSPLRQRMLDALVLRGKAERTQESYIDAVARLARHYRRSPDTLNCTEVQKYLLHLLQQRHLSRSSVNQYGCAFRFFYGIGGNSLLAASERAMGAPSRTRTAASWTAWRIGELVTTSPAMRSASSTGTALAVRIEKVRAKRAALLPRVMRPNTGMRSFSRSN